MPSAPGRLSIIAGFPQRSASRSANSRAARSTELPGGPGVTKRTVRSGQDAPDAGAYGWIAMVSPTAIAAERGRLQFTVRMLNIEAFRLLRSGPSLKNIG